ncbi:hypothetical protein CHUAL_006033 [Chamberlinius hualienensis]
MKAPKHPDHFSVDGGVIVGSGSEREDFSDYMWMEDLENFDKEVLAELEEEEEMEQCIEEMLAEEEARDTTYYLIDDFDSSSLYHSINYPSQLLTDDEQELEIAMANLCFSDERILILSELNPNAEEFIPNRMSSPLQSNISISSAADGISKHFPGKRDEPDR